MDEGGFSKDGGGSSATSPTRKENKFFNVPKKFEGQTLAEIIEGDGKGEKRRGLLGYSQKEIKTWFEKIFERDLIQKNQLSLEQTRELAGVESQDKKTGLRQIAEGLLKAPKDMWEGLSRRLKTVGGSIEILLAEAIFQTYDKETMPNMEEVITSLMRHGGDTVVANDPQHLFYVLGVLAANSQITGRDSILTRYGKNWSISPQITKYDYLPGEPIRTQTGQDLSEQLWGLFNSIKPDVSEKQFAVSSKEPASGRSPSSK